MSVIFDCFWWWRAEFAGQADPYTTSHDDPLREVNRTSRMDMLSNTQIPGITVQEEENREFLYPTLPADPFPDWEWAAGLDFPGSNDLRLSTL
jgi:transcriptional regulatory protein LEU3